MNKDLKIAFFDFDGTLFDHYLDRICPKSIEGLLKLKAQGFKLCIATGRPTTVLDHILNLTDQINFDYIVCSNGQTIYKDGQIIYQNYLNENDINAAFKHALDHDLAFGYVTSEGEFISKLSHEVKAAFDGLKLPYPDVKEIYVPFDQKIEYLVGYGTLDDKKAYEQILKHTKVTSWHPLAFDLVPDNGLKVHGVAKVLEMEGLSKHQAIAFGDGENDLEMLGYVEVGVALGNACPLLLNVADVVTDHISNEGLYKALLKLNLIKE